MIRKIFLGVSLLAIAGVWTGCSNDEVMDATSSEARAIDFRVQGGVPAVSRTTTTTKDKVDAFVVYGTDDVATANIFDGVTVARVAETATYTYSPLRYYSVGAAYADFVAYSPVSAKMTSSVPASLTTSAPFNYELAAPNSTGTTAQDDLLVSAMRVEDNDFNNSVSFTFQHALSRLFVKASNPLNEIITIKSLTLNNLYSKGTITATYSSGWTWGWGNSQNTAKPYSFILPDTGVALPAGADKQQVVSAEQGMMVIPQTTVDNGDETLDSGEFNIEISYIIGNQTASQTRNFFFKQTLTFDISTQYAILISFTGLNEIEFAITDVGGFTAGDDIP
ncbi:fimbrillin family protein [Bacteroides sp. OttesenSCG-928-E20]|nr:fimbrillin family protein [Bacteroides sp. OttesenSCG-928-E20]